MEIALSKRSALAQSGLSWCFRRPAYAGETCEQKYGYSWGPQRPRVNACVHLKLKDNTRLPRPPFIRPAFSGKSLRSSIENDDRSWSPISLLHVDAGNCNGPGFFGTFDFCHNIFRLWLGRINSVGAILKSRRRFGVACGIKFVHRARNIDRERSSGAGGIAGASLLLLVIARGIQELSGVTLGKCRHCE